MRNHVQILTLIVALPGCGGAQSPTAPAPLPFPGGALTTDVPPPVSAGGGVVHDARIAILGVGQLSGTAWYVGADCRHLPPPSCDGPYSHRSLVISNDDNTEIIAQVTTDDRGQYAGELPEGTYQVWLQTGLAFPNNWWRTVATVGDSTLSRADLHVDVGIR